MRPFDTPPTVTPARYAKGMMAVSCPSPDGFKTRAARLAEYLKGRYTHRERAYILSPTKARKLLDLFQAGYGVTPIRLEMIKPDDGGT